MIYFFVWAVINTIIAARNEVVLETQYTNKGQIADRLKRPLMQVVAALGLFGLLVLTAQLSFGFLTQLFLQSLLQWPAPVAWANLLAAVIGLAINIYIIVAAAQLVFLID